MAFAQVPKQRCIPGVAEVARESELYYTRKGCPREREKVLVVRHGCIPHFVSPTGLCMVAQGCRAAATLGRGGVSHISTLKGLRRVAAPLRNPVGVVCFPSPSHPG